MIIFTKDSSVLNRFLTFREFFEPLEKDATPETLLRLWKEAGGKVMEGDSLFVLHPSENLRATITDALSGDAVKYSVLPGDFILEAQMELDDAREMIELQQESLRVKNEEITKLQRRANRLRSIIIEMQTDLEHYEKMIGAE